MSSYTTAIVSITACLAHAPKKCTQSGNFQFDIKSPSDFKILSARKLKTLFQKYKLELTTGIHACIGHASCVNTREFLKDTTTADSHENVAWKSEFTFFQSLSWLFQLAYFVKCKRTLLELNFYQPYPSSWREWILSLLVFVLHKTWNKSFPRVVVQLTAKKCTKKRDALAKLLFCLVSRRRRILNFLDLPIIYDTLWSVKNRIFWGQIQLLLLIASQTFFQLIGSSFVSGWESRK